MRKKTWKSFERASQTQSFCNTTLLILSLFALTQPRELLCWWRQILLQIELDVCSKIIRRSIEDYLELESLKSVRNWHQQQQAQLESLAWYKFPSTPSIQIKPAKQIHTHLDIVWIIEELSLKWDATILQKISEWMLDHKAKEKLTMVSSILNFVT